MAQGKDVSLGMDNGEGEGGLRVEDGFQEKNSLKKRCGPRKRCVAKDG